MTKRKQYLMKPETKEAIEAQQWIYRVANDMKLARNQLEAALAMYANGSSMSDIKQATGYCDGYVRAQASNYFIRRNANKPGRITITNSNDNSGLKSIRNPSYLVKGVDFSGKYQADSTNELGDDASDWNTGGKEVSEAFKLMIDSGNSETDWSAARKDIDQTMSQARKDRNNLDELKELIAALPDPTWDVPDLKFTEQDRREFQCNMLFKYPFLKADESNSYGKFKEKQLGESRSDSYESILRAVIDQNPSLGDETLKALESLARDAKESSKKYEFKNSTKKEFEEGEEVGVLIGDNRGDYQWDYNSSDYKTGDEHSLSIAEQAKMQLEELVGSNQQYDLDTGLVETQSESQKRGSIHSVEALLDLVEEEANFEDSKDMRMLESEANENVLYNEGHLLYNIDPASSMHRMSVLSKSQAGESSPSYLRLNEDYINPNATKLTNEMLLTPIQLKCILDGIHEHQAVVITTSKTHKYDGIAMVLEEYLLTMTKKSSECTESISPQQERRFTNDAKIDKLQDSLDRLTRTVQIAINQMKDN